MIHFTTQPLNHEGTLEHDVFRVPSSPSTEEVLHSHARLWEGPKLGSIDPELELYNFVADCWPFITLISR